MGCAASKAAAASPPSTSESIPKPVAFEVPIEEGGGDAPPTKQEVRLPPQLQQRMDAAYNQASLTVEELREKQQKAEERRLNILEEKARIARQAQKMFNKGETPNGENKAEENKDGEEAS